MHVGFFCRFFFFFSPKAKSLYCLNSKLNVYILHHLFIKPDHLIDSHQQHKCFLASGPRDFHAHCTVDRTIVMLCVEVVSRICLDWIYLAHACNSVPAVYVAWGVGQPARGNALCHVRFEMEADSSPKHHVMLADCNCSSNLRPVVKYWFPLTLMKWTVCYGERASKLMMETQ